MATRKRNDIIGGVGDYLQVWPQEVPSRGGKDVEWWPAKAKHGLSRERTGHPRKSAVKGAPGGADLNVIPNAEVCAEK